MSTPAPAPSDEVNIEVNGVPMKARKGQMIIHATDTGDGRATSMISPIARCSPRNNRKV